MATLPQKITELWLSKLAESSDISAEQIALLRKELAAQSKLKPERLEAIYHLVAIGAK